MPASLPEFCGDMTSEPMPIALVAFRVPSEPCFTGRGKSAGLLPGALRAASDENMDRAPAELCTLWVLVDIACLYWWTLPVCIVCSNVAAMILLMRRSSI